VLVTAGCTGAGVPPANATVAPASADTGLPAGEYRSNVFAPPINYTLPSGWRVAADDVDYFALQPVTSDLIGIHVFRSPSAASQEADCPIAPAPLVGSTAKDLVAWIAGRPGLVVGEPVAVSIGGLSGLQVDAAIVDGWTPSCPFADGAPTVPLFVNPSDPNFRWVIGGSERLRLSVLDVPGKGTVVVDIDAFDGSQMDGLLAAATPIVASMRFGLP
jgi:hypothetical protein